MEEVKLDLADLLQGNSTFLFDFICKNASFGCLSDDNDRGDHAYCQKIPDGEYATYDNLFLALARSIRTYDSIDRVYQYSAEHIEKLSDSIKNVESYIERAKEDLQRWQILHDLSEVLIQYKKEHFEPSK